MNGEMHYEAALGQANHLTISNPAAAQAPPPCKTYSGDDVIDGRGGPDTLRGRQGADTITGGSGNDTLYGDAGYDTLNGGADSDLCYPGADGAAVTSCSVLAPV